MADERIVAIGLLTKGDVERLGETFTRLWPIEDCENFADLLQEIDQADEQRQKQD